MSAPSREDFNEACYELDEDVMLDMFNQLRNRYEEQQKELDKAHDVCRQAYKKLLFELNNSNDRVNEVQQMLMDFTIIHERDEAVARLGYEHLLENDLLEDDEE